MLKKFKLRIYFLVYCVLMIGLAFYWGNNWQKYEQYKGDYFEYCLDFVFLLIYLFSILFYISIRKVNLLLLFLMPLIITILSVILGFAIECLFGIDDFPTHEIVVFTLTYMAIAVLWFFLLAKRIGKRSIRHS